MQSWRAHFLVCSLWKVVLTPSVFWNANCGLISSCTQLVLLFSARVILEFVSLVYTEKEYAPSSVGERH